MLQLLKDRHIPYVLFFPPFAPTVVSEMGRYALDYAYIKDLKSKLKKDDIAFHDFEDTSGIASPDCEFVDGFHGGSVTYARLLLSLASIEPKIHSVIDTSALRVVINRNQGHAMIRDSRVTSDPETDFLGIGCKK
jgi:hypothetical protein